MRPAFIRITGALMERDELDKAFDERCRRAGVVGEYYTSTRLAHDCSYVLLNKPSLLYRNKPWVLGWYERGRVSDSDNRFESKEDALNALFQQTIRHEYIQTLPPRTRELGAPPGHPHITVLMPADPFPVGELSFAIHCDSGWIGGEPSDCPFQICAIGMPVRGEKRSMINLDPHHQLRLEFFGPVHVHSPEPFPLNLYEKTTPCFSERITFKEPALLRDIAHEHRCLLYVDPGHLDLVFTASTDPSYAGKFRAFDPNVLQELLNTPFSPHLGQSGRRQDRNSSPI